MKFKLSKENVLSGIIAILLFALLTQSLWATGTLVYRGTEMQNAPLFDSFVFDGTLAGDSDTFTIPTTFVADEVDMWYTKATGLDYTAPLKIRSISGTTYTIEGDTGETYTIILKDYTDF